MPNPISTPLPARKAALITGAARRIGCHIAHRLVADGFNVALHTSERSKADADALATTLGASGRQVMVVVADLSDASATAQIIPAVTARLGAPTLLINNASLFEKDEIVGLNPAVFDIHMAVNLRAPLQLAAAFLQFLPKEERGNIINVIDQRVWRLNPNFFSYTLSKAALWTATQTMAQALAPRIRVNGIGPGPTLANIRQDQSEFDKQASAIPLGEAVSPSEIADAVMYLLHAKSVTGQMIAVDGGQHLAWETPDVAGIVE